MKVRELQSRLFQLAWFPELTTGHYDVATREAVQAFQDKHSRDKRRLEANGVTDERTWDLLVSMTKKPTHDQLFNILHPGPAILTVGDRGTEVRDLQARLVSIQWIFGDVTVERDDLTLNVSLYDNQPYLLMRVLGPCLPTTAEQQVEYESAEDQRFAVPAAKVDEARSLGLVVVVDEAR